MKKCNYCGRNVICKGSYPEGCFLENEILKEQYLFKERYRAMKKAMGWTNQDVADIMGSKLNSVEVSTSKPDTDFPRWGKLAVEVYEQMIARGRITYDQPEEYKAEGGKE